MPVSRLISNPTQQVSGIILAGGAGSRMGGADKGLVEWRGKPLIEYTLERLKPQVADIVINANRNRDRYLEYGWPVVSDWTQAESSPLAGILAAGRAAQLDWLLIVPVDAPLMPRNLSFRMAGPADADARRAHDGMQPQNNFVLVHRRSLFDAYRLLVKGQLEPDAWMDRVKALSVYFGEQMGAFFDVNTLDDARKLEQVGAVLGL